MTAIPTVPRPAAGRAWLAELRATLALSVPIALSNLAQIAIHTTDVVMMGWLGPGSLAAGALAANLLFPLHYFAIGVIMATAAIIAQALGARDYRQVRRAVRQGAWVAAAIGLLVGLTLWHGEWIILTAGQVPQSAALAGEYLRVALWGFLPSLWFAVLRNFVVGHSRTRAPLIITLGAIVLNAVSNYGLMFGNFGLPRLELAGAALSSVMVNVAMVLALLWYVLADRRLRRYRILARFWRPDWPLFREILRLGLPIGLTTLAEAGLFAVSTFLMGLIGTLHVAAYTIALQCAGIVFMVPLGVGQAATVRVGYAAGAGDIARARRAGGVALLIGLGLAAASAALLWLGDEAIVRLFLLEAAESNHEVAALAVLFLHLAALFQFFDATQTIAAGALRGLKDTRTPMLIAVFGYWAVGVSAAVWLAFGLDLGGAGIWYGQMLALGVVAILLTWRFHLLSR